MLQFLYLLKKICFVSVITVSLAYYIIVHQLGIFLSVKVDMKIVFFYLNEHILGQFS